MSMPFHKQRLTTKQNPQSVMYDYPGLGLPLRYNEQGDYGFYPIGAHGSNYGSDSDLIFVRELAMMDVMEKLTDKPDWHKKVFDDEIVDKWRREALAVPDQEFYQLATSGKKPWEEQEQEPEEEEDSDEYYHIQRRGDGIDSKPEGILSQRAFDYVSFQCTFQWAYGQLTLPVYRGTARQSEVL